MQLTQLRIDLESKHRQREQSHHDKWAAALEEHTEKKKLFERFCILFVSVIFLFKFPAVIVLPNAMN